MDARWYYRKSNCWLSSDCRIAGDTALCKNIHESVSRQMKKNFAKAKWRVSGHFLSSFLQKYILHWTAWKEISNSVFFSPHSKRLTLPQWSDTWGVFSSAAVWIPLNTGSRIQHPCPGRVSLSTFPQATTMTVSFCLNISWNSKLLLTNLSYSSAVVCCVLYYVVLSNSPWGGCYLCLGSSMQAANSSSKTPERRTRPSTVTTIITGSKWHHFLSDCSLNCCTLWKDAFSPI